MSGSNSRGGKQDNFKLLSLSGNQADVNLTKSGFGELSTAENTAFIQGTAVYDLIPTNFREFTNASGTTGAEDGLFKVTTGTSVGGYGAIQSFRALNYKAGDGALARFTAIFETNVANSWQGVGLINLGDELSFGYNGTSFGIWHRYRGIAEVRTITVSGAAGGSETLILTLNDVGYSIPLTTGTTAHNAYEIASWLNANQSIWAADSVSDTVIVSALSDGAKSGTYSYSSSTSTGSIASTTVGVTKTSDFIAQENWNGVDVSAWLDPSKGNVYQIQYQYLGFGNFKFFIEDPTSGEFVLVHTLQYTNKNVLPSVGNPSLRVGLYCVSLGSTTDLTVKSGSLAAFTQGKNLETRNPRAFQNTQTVTTAFTNILTIRNRRTYNGKINQVEIAPRFLSVASESGKNVEIEIRSTSNPGVEQTFNTIGTDLITDASTTATTVTGGRLLTAITVAGNTSQIIDLDKLRIRLPPSLYLIIQGRVTSGANASVTAALTWYEDL